MTAKYSTCELCCKEKDLRESHIIPKFVFDWQKESSGTGFLRSSRVPNRRVQDGAKEYMLCSDCETLFNQWETSFATNIFHPLNRRENIQFEYRYKKIIVTFRFFTNATKFGSRSINWSTEIETMAFPHKALVVYNTINTDH